MYVCGVHRLGPVHVEMGACRCYGHVLSAAAAAASAAAAIMAVVSFGCVRSCVRLVRATSFNVKVMPLIASDLLRRPAEPNKSPGG